MNKTIFAYQAFVIAVFLKSKVSSSKKTVDLLKIKQEGSNWPCGQM